MPKSTDDHLGHKLKQAMELKGVRNIDVANAFDVKPPTVSSDWIKHGRIGKQHYQRLVDYFGLPYEWWFGKAGTDQKISAVIRQMLTMTEEQKDAVVKATFPDKKSNHKPGKKNAG